MLKKFLCVLFLLPISISVTFAQGVPPAATREFPPYKVYPGTLDENGIPISGARLCTIETRVHCFGFVPFGEKSDKDDLFDFGLRPTSQRITLRAGGSVVLFNANSGGGSGSSDEYVLLRSETDGHLKNLLPQVFVSNQADVAMWDLPTVSPMPVLVTADFIWGDMEGHYGNHFFEVRMYLYDPSTDRYKLSHKYRTAHKYPGIDNWEQAPEVLDKERNRIIEKLGAQ